MSSGQCTLFLLIPEIPLHNVKLSIRGILIAGFKNEVSNNLVTEQTLEFAIVQDADRLDAIGAIGKHCIIEDFCNFSIARVSLVTMVYNFSVQDTACLML